jgi:hypothetical protein
MKVDLTKSNCIVLHLERAKERQVNVDALKKTHPKLEVWKAKDLDLLDDETKNKYLQYNFFHRIPNKHSDKRNIIGWCLNALQHIEILNYIVKNKIDDVIVFEDDARLYKLEEIEINDEDYYYLGGFEYKKGKICLQHAMYYPSWERLEKMLVVLNNPKKLKTIDYMFSNFIQPKFKYGFSNFYYQEGDSLIQKDIGRCVETQKKLMVSVITKEF